MLQIPPLHDDLLRAVDAMAHLPLQELLDQHGILRNLAQELALNAIRQAVCLSPREQQEMLTQVCAGLGCDPPTGLAGDWIATLPEPLRETARQRWDQVRLLKALDHHYGERLEAHFLNRRHDLEQVVFRLMRLPQQGLAEELYLRLVDDHASFGDLAGQYSLGDERVTRGIVGPIEIAQLHTSIQTVLRTLSQGECHPPFRLDHTILLIRLEHRSPACLSEAMRHRLLEELLQPDLQACIDAALAALARSSAPVAQPLAPSLVLAGG